jgi:trk system potassium uptake protein TrkA
MYILVVGGGKTGSHLADILLGDGHEVTVIEKRPDVLAKLEAEAPNAAIVQGDGCDPLVLENAGVNRADVVAAVTGDDEDNLVVSSLAKRQYGVRRVIARINNHKNEWLFTKEMGVDAAVSKAHIIAKLIEEETAIRDIVTILKLRRGNVALLQETLEEGARAVGQRLSELGLPKNCVLVTVLRGNEVLFPSGDTVFQAGDEILAVANVASEADLEKALNG